MFYVIVYRRAGDPKDRYRIESIPKGEVMARYAQLFYDNGKDLAVYRQIYCTDLADLRAKLEGEAK